MHLTKLSSLHPHYPALLREIKNPPQLLYLRGELNISGRALCAIVGTRRPDAYGIYVTRLYASALARAGVVIVSGLAYGLDAVAHQAALDVGGTTIAVLGSGADVIMPRANRRLGEAIIAHGGAIISEQEPGTAAFAGNIVARNRIIAGMSHVTFVAQAAENSGTLHTAHAAQDNGRSVFATPGMIINPRSSGSNDLLRCDVAHPTTSPLDVLEALQDVLKPSTPETEVFDKMPLSQREATVLHLIERGTTTIDALLDSCGLTPGELAETMSLLEITGRITNLGAGHWVIKQRRTKAASKQTGVSSGTL